MKRFAKNLRTIHLITKSVDLEQATRIKQNLRPILITYEYKDFHDRLIE